MGVLEFINFISNFIGSGSNLWEIIWGFCLTYLTDSLSHVLEQLFMATPIVEKYYWLSVPETNFCLILDTLQIYLDFSITLSKNCWFANYKLFLFKEPHVSFAFLYNWKQFTEI